MLTAILICGTSVFTACTVDNADNPTVEPDLNLAENLIGKWINVVDDGYPTPTNQKIVLSFLSPTKAQFSLSAYSPVTAGWVPHQDCDVVINGNHTTQRPVPVCKGKMLIIHLFNTL